MMINKSIRRTAGIILAGALLLSDIFTFQSKAFYKDSVSVGDVVERFSIEEGNESVMESDAGRSEGTDAESDITSDEDISVSGNDGSEEQEPETDEDSKDGEDEETTEEPDEESKEEITEEPGGESEDEIGKEPEEDTGVSVSGNTVLVNGVGSFDSGNGMPEEQAEADMGEILGDTLPVKDSSNGLNMQVPYIVGDMDRYCKGDEEPKEKDDLQESEQGGQLIQTENRGQDWAYALCNALESGLKIKRPDDDVSIDREELVAYLYSTNKDSEINKYGSISKDKVMDPENGRGNVNTAMWAAATGYSIKNINAPNQRYCLKNIYIYSGVEQKLIKQAIKKRGEVVTSIYWNEKGFQENEQFTGDKGYYISYHCNDEWVKEQEAPMEHSVTIVGWNDNYPYTNFKNIEDEKWYNNNGEEYDKWMSASNGAWLIKDAYGYDNQYYYWVSYYDYIWHDGRKCFFYSFDIEEDCEEAHTYQYDGGSGISKGEYTTAVNIFPKAEQDEVLKAVSFGTLTRDAQYKIQVYLEAKPAEDNGELVLEKPLFQDGIITEKERYTEWGYYTIDLERYKDKYICEPRLSNIEDNEEYFAVEVTIISSNGQSTSFWEDSATVDGVLPVCNPDKNNEGQSYIYEDGKWVDLSSIREGSNVRIKAHTQDRFTLKASSNNVWLGDDLELTASIGGRSVGTTDLEWHSDNEEIIYVSEDGTDINVKNAGTANITVTSDKYGSDTLEIMVKDMTFSPEHFLLCSNSVNKERRQGQITCKFYPEKYQPDRIIYRVKNQEYDPYLFVDENNGVVTVKEAAGSMKNIPVQVRIYDDEVNFIDREVWVDCYQTPKKFEIVNAAQETQDDFVLKAYEERQLGIRILEPIDAVSSDITWKTSNAAVVSVNSSGKICALKEGTADIMAVSSDDPDNMTKVRVTVGTVVSRISFGESYITLQPEESRKLEIKVIPEKADRSGILYTLTDLDGNNMGLLNESLSFDPDTGMLTAGSENMKITKFRLYVECDGIKSSCYIKINVPARDLRLSFSENSIVTSKNVTTSVSDQRINPIMLYCHLEPETLSAGDVSLLYYSDNPDVARVTKSGEVIPMKAGSVNLTAETEEGLSARVHLVIESMYASENLSLNINDSKLYVGGWVAAEPETTVAVVTKKNGSVAPAEDFDWKSSDESVAVVDESGKVKALSAGSTTITAIDKLDSTNRVSKTLQVGIGVREIRTERDVVEIAKYNTVSIHYDVLPSDADERTATLYADDEGIVQCGEGEIYGIKAGATTVNIESENGVSKAVYVKVMDQEASYIKAELIREGAEVGYITTKGTNESQAQIKAEAMNESGSTVDVSQIFDYYSQDPAIAQVDEYGYVTGGNEGETQIIVSATDGSGINTVVNVIVQKKDSGIKSVVLNHNTLELQIGERQELIATTLPENAAGMHGVTWSTMDETVADVDLQGMVQAKGYGRTWIIAESLDGKKSIKCEVKVLPIDSGIKLLKIGSQTLENRQINPQSCYQISVLADDGKDYRTYCEFTSSNEKICTVNRQGMVLPVNGADTGVSTITAKVQNDPLGRKVSFQVKLSDKAQAADIRLYAKVSTGKKEVGVDKPLYLPFEIGETVGLEGVAVDRNGSLIKENSLKWSVSDNKILSVKQQKDGKANVTLKGNGSCVLTCSVSNQPQVSVSVPVYVYDRKPVLTQKNVAVNLSKNETISIPFQKCVGTEIEELHLLYIKKGKEYWEKGFDITQDLTDTGKYLLEYHSEDLKKGNYIVYAKAAIKFDNSEAGKILKEVYHDQDSDFEILEIPIKVTEQKPKITIKQPVLNVFTKGAEEKLVISAGGEEIDKIELSDGKTSGINSKFKLEKQNGEFWLRALGKEKGTYQAVFSVYVKGYDNANPISVKCTIKTVINKPKLKAETEKLFVCKGEKEAADASFRIYDPLTNEFISEGKGYVITKGAVLQDDLAVISGLNVYGKKTIELSVKNESMWNDEVSLKIPVVVESETKMSLEASSNKITLNKRLNGDCASVSIYMKQQNVQVISVHEVDIYNSTGRLSRDITWTWNTADAGENIIEFRTQDSCTKGKYRIEITAKVQRKETDAVIKTRTCKKLLTLVVEDTLPTVKVKLKGSIDLYNRQETYMMGVVNVNHAASKVIDVNSERDDFTVVYDEETEQFTLHLKQNRKVSKKKQTVILKIKLYNGTELQKAVTVSLKESAIKWKKQDAETLYKSTGSRSVVIPFETEAPLGEDIKIKVLSLPKGLRTDADHGQLTVSLDYEGIKPGKYKIKTNVWILDSDGVTPLGSTAIKKETVIWVR